MGKKKASTAGFTLVELLMVVVIIGFIAAVAIPQYSLYKAKAYNSSALSDLQNFKIAMEACYYDSNHTYPIF